MPRLILPKSNLREILKERRARGADRLDEVWSGVYVMSPEADNQHQRLSGRFFAVLDEAASGVEEATAYPSINVSDDPDNWRRNYRVPDAAVFLPGNPAEDRESHWLGGPDFAVEVVSPGDRSRKKFDFYASVGVRELLIVDRRPWRLDLHHRVEGRWESIGTSVLPTSALVMSRVLPLTFRLLPGVRRPQIEVRRADGPGSWTI